MITLLSDWKLRDPYLGIFKGQLATLLPNVPITDISHSIELFNGSQAAFILKSSYCFFPEKSLHIILTGLNFSSQAKPILVTYNNHYFLGEDSGIFTMMFGCETDFKPVIYNGDMNKTATEKLALMAQWFFQNNLETNTAPYSKLKLALSQLSNPDFDENQSKICGKVAYIDSCCNAVTNIPISMFEKGNNRPFTAHISSTRQLVIKRIHKFYNSKEDEIFFVYNRLGFLEITMYEANVALLADINVCDSVEIRFE